MLIGWLCRCWNAQKSTAWCEQISRQADSIRDNVCNDYNVYITTQRHLVLTVSFNLHHAAVRLVSLHYSYHFTDEESGTYRGWTTDSKSQDLARHVCLQSLSSFSSFFSSFILEREGEHGHEREEVQKVRERERDSWVDSALTVEPNPSRGGAWSQDSKTTTLSSPPELKPRVT